MNGLNYLKHLNSLTKITRIFNELRIFSGAHNKNCKYNLMLKKASLAN